MNIIHYSEVDKDRIIYLNTFRFLFALMLIIGIILFLLKIQHEAYELLLFLGSGGTLLGLVGSFFLRNTKYVIRGYEIKYTISFITVFEFDIRKIRKIDKKYLKFGIYGNSRKKNIRIEFLNGEQINISPEDSKKFIEDIVKLNPNIGVEW